MKKVLHISKYYYPFMGGTEQVARDIVHVLNKSDQYVQKVICFNENSDHTNIICHIQQDQVHIVDGVEVFRCGVDAKYASQALSLSYSKHLKRIMNEFQPDIVFLHYPNPFVTHLLLKYKKRKFQLVTYWHLDITKQKILGKLFYGQSHTLLKRSDAVVATSPNYVEGSPYLQCYKEKITVIPNCINERRFIINQEIEKRAAEIKKEYRNKKLCFSIGRHVLYKGYTYLIEASQYLEDEFRIVIGGTGKLTETLKQQAQEDHKVHWIGRISDKELIAYYLACDILCFPSITKNEAFGLVLAEGMYFGKPAVTFTIPGSGVNYVNIHGVTGIECPNGDSRAYAEALKKLAQKPDLRKQYGDAARQRVQENFTIDKFYQNVKGLVDSF